MNLPIDVIELIFLYISPEYIEKFYDFDLSDYFWETYVEEHFAPQYSILPERNYKGYVFKMLMDIYPYMINDQTLKWGIIEDFIDTDNDYIFLDQYRRVIGQFSSIVHAFKHKYNVRARGLFTLNGYIFLQPKNEIIYVLQVSGVNKSIKNLIIKTYIRNLIKDTGKSTIPLRVLIFTVPAAQKEYENVIVDTSIWPTDAKDIVIE